MMCYAAPDQALERDGVQSLNPADVQLRVDRLLDGVECAFVIASCADSECMGRYSATVRELKRVGARVIEAKLPYTAVVALKQVSGALSNTSTRSDHAFDHELSPLINPEYLVEHISYPSPVRGRSKRIHVRKRKGPLPNHPPVELSSRSSSAWRRRSRVAGVGMLQPRNRRGSGRIQPQPRHA